MAIVVWGVLPLVAQLGSGQQFSADSVRFFENDVRPVLLTKCAACHNDELRTGGLSIESREAILAGGTRGEAAIPGSPDDSLLIHAIRRNGELKMPPGGALNPDELAALVRWVELGLPWPTQPHSGSPADEPSKHWSFQPVRRPREPTVSDTSWARNPIDRFILARHEKVGLTPSPEAERATLARRVYIDLVGLLPTPEQVDTFVADDRPDAYELLVDEVLASPHYGERWGRHWLDIARYADSNGYNDDGPRKIWMYREWVIDALNRDLPFDQFVIEQIAGDLLPNPTKQQIVATGFHRNTLLNLEGGVDFEQYRTEAVVDRVDTTGIAFLGLTLGCARCHDHKFDPISQREFYRFFAFFNSIDELSGEFNDKEGRERANEPVLELGTPEQHARREGIQAQLKVMEQELDRYKDQLIEKQSDWEASLSDEALQKLAPSQQAILKIPMDERHEVQHDVIRGAYFGQDFAYQERRKAIAAVKKIEPEVPSTLVMRELPQPRPTHVLLGGEFLNKGVEVTPGTPAALPTLPQKESHTRGDLARWLVDEKNPLTPRVTMNRMWQRYFGRGIVETENDFGTQGSPPTHPELLDWLASEFIAQGWSLKAMHRLIVTSATYRQSSAHRPDSKKLDPRNDLLSRQNRLRVESEIVRDLALSASGMLTPEIGGPSVFPAQPPDYMIRRTWKESEGPARYRRGMYTYFWRLSPHPGLMVFDSPTALTITTKRDRSNTPLQALTLLNDAGFHEFAQGLAQRILTESTDASNSERVNHAFRLCLARPPTEPEKERLEHLLAAQLDEFRTTPGAAKEILPLPTPENADIPATAAWTVVSGVLLNLDEFITRE
ncbi:MAG: PSD1 and planctomycete cytochrome C domain-containing protein [Acidobacteria bacterium]|nr:PSD1 and planctomycete cytochrome C domain-containing protein [Acidobacteriota bacterium]